MQKIFIICILLTACCAEGLQDLSGKVFNFPVESNTARVKLQPSPNMYKQSARTVCLRFFTQLTRAYSLFSVASNTKNNDFLLFKMEKKGKFKLVTHHKAVYFHGLPDEQNTWYSICATWESNSGLSQVWINGNPSTKEVGFKGPLDERQTIILGQDQDSVDGGYDAKQSFVGNMTDVHMWDYVISACQIRRFANNWKFTPGNVLNWKALDYSTNGRVSVEDKS